MKIAILSRWNTACGVSLHAELIGREFIKMGHELVVFAPNNIRPVAEDEDYVIRCYSDEGDHTETFFDERPFLENDYEIFLAERIEWTPIKHLRRIFSEIRKKAKTIYVIHERKPPSSPLFYEFEWDAVICFDERYRRQWSKIFRDKIHIIPYPVPEVRRGDKREARKTLNLPLDERIVFSYGWAPELHVLPILPYLKDVSRIEPFTYLLLVDPNSGTRIPEYDFISLRIERPPLERIYTYLHAADLCLMHKQWDEVREGEVAISSSVLMCLGSLTPIITSDTGFVEFLEDEVLKYRSFMEFKQLLIKTLRGEVGLKKVIRAAERYARRNSPRRIASKFIKLFNEI